MASAAGVALSTWRGYEGESRGTLPRSDALQALCRLGISGEWLLTGDGPMLRQAQASGELDESAQAAAITAIEEHLDRNHLKLEPDKKSALISIIYKGIISQKSQQGENAQLDEKGFAEDRLQELSRLIA